MYQIQKLKDIQSKNNSIISLGLDLDAKKMPADFVGSTKKMFDFVHRIIDATSDKVCAYKPNMAFFERYGADGFSLLKQIVRRVPDDIPVIVDGKRGDIGNTASHYAAAMFEGLEADWVTINPYMGYDSIRPFIEYKEKGVFILCLTSNTGSKDFQHLQTDGMPLYRQVAEKVKYWDKDFNCGLVVGATHPDELKEIRGVAADMPILIPGVGAQGGDLELAAFNGTANFTKPALINVSRSVLYASQDLDFAQKAREEIIKLNEAISAARTGQPVAVGESSGSGSDSPAEQPDNG
jgi:orotidine-5'-phosphate decarboxylase